MPTLSDILKVASPKSSWAAWVANDTSPAAQETRLFLDVCLSNIRSTKQTRLLQRIQKADLSGIEAAIHELVAHELLRRLGFSPEFDPQISSVTPDLSVEIAGDRFIADVFVTHNPSRTVLEAGPGFLFTRDSGERSLKIADTIRIKSMKYAKTHLPLILFAFLGDHSLGISDIERALFGITIREIELTISSLLELKEDERINGVFLSEEIGKPNHSNVSAVIACDWFDTLNRANPGKRLHCTVFHHWHPITPLPLDVFRDFPQVAWQQELDRWKSSIVGEANIAKFTDSDGIEFGIYTADKPW